MADDLTLNAGTGGATLATDEVVGGQHYQRVKLTDGTADSTTVIAAGNGAAATALRVTLASDSTGVVSVDDNGGSLTVDGTVAATQSGTWNITNVSGTVSLPTGAATAAKQPALGTAGSASADVISVQGIASMTALTVDGSAVTQPVSNAGLTELAAAINASRMDVNLAASAATVTVDGSGVTQPVSGTITANLSATDNTVLDTIETNTSGSTSHYRNIDANAEAEIKGSAGTLFWLHAMNLTAAKAYLHLYDATAASVTPGTTTPTFTFALPTQGDANGAGFVLPAAIEFANGITLVCTTTLDGSTGDPGTNGVVVNAGYT